MDKFLPCPYQIIWEFPPHSFVYQSEPWPFPDCQKNDWFPPQTVFHSAAEQWRCRFGFRSPWLLLWCTCPCKAMPPATGTWRQAQGIHIIFLFFSFLEPPLLFCLYYSIPKRKSQYLILYKIILILAWFFLDILI